MTVTENVINSSMITRDGYTYAWTDKSLGKGTKVKMVESAEESTTTPSAMTWAGEQVGDYTCEEWTADDSVFVLPKNITFTATS